MVKDHCLESGLEWEEIGGNRVKMGQRVRCGLEGGLETLHDDPQYPTGALQWGYSGVTSGLLPGVNRRYSELKWR